MIVLTTFGLASGCSDPLQNLANTEASDLTDAVAYPKAGNKSDGLISAFYGLTIVFRPLLLTGCAALWE